MTRMILPLLLLLVASAPTVTSQSIYSRDFPFRCDLSSDFEATDFEDVVLVPYVGDIVLSANTSAGLEALLLEGYNGEACGYRNAETAAVSVNPSIRRNLLFRVTGRICLFCPEPTRGEGPPGMNGGAGGGGGGDGGGYRKLKPSFFKSSDDVDDDNDQEENEFPDKPRSPVEKQPRRDLRGKGKGKGSPTRRPTKRPTKQPTEEPSASPSFSQQDICPVCEFSSQVLVEEFQDIAQIEADNGNLPGIRFVGECPPQISLLTSAALVTFNLTEENEPGSTAPPDEVVAVENSFTNSYNGLNFERCDEQFRVVQSASFFAKGMRLLSSTVVEDRYGGPVDRRRKLTTVSADYQADVNGTCRRCSSTTTLFDDSRGRRRDRSRQLSVADLHARIRRNRQRRLQSLEDCACSAESNFEGTAPTTDEFLPVYDVDIKAQELANIVGVLSLRELPKDSDSPTVSPSVAPTECTTYVQVDHAYYQFGEEIVVVVNNCEPRLTDWVGIVFADSPIDNLFYFRMWLYACGSRSCRRRVERGEVVFGPGGPFEGEQDNWPLNAGSYRVVLLRDGPSPPYQPLAFTDTFQVGHQPRPTNPRVSTDKGCYKRGSDIKVSVVNPDPQAYDFVAFYDEDVNLHNVRRPLMWLHVCGDQHCGKAKSQAQLVFGAGPPVETDRDSWPLNVGTYRVLLLRGYEYPYDVIDAGNTFDVIPLSGSCH